MKSQKYVYLPHTADVKFQAFGKNLNFVFENSALAFSHAMYAGKVKRKLKKRVNIRGNGNDFESLLYNFLEQLIILLDSENFFLSKAKVKINEKKMTLSAELHGDDAKNYKIGLDVKAITYNEMFVKKVKDKWACQVVLDV
jgi:SHS2 domain-containing protein